MRIAILAAAIVIPLPVLGHPSAAQHTSDTQNHQTRVTEPFSDPAFESVCHLYIRRRVALLLTWKYTGSALLYRGRYLLTAGHNVYQDRSGIRTVQVRCGNADARTAVVDEAIEPWQALDADGYSGHPFSRDFGVIRLNRSINVPAPFRLASRPVRSGEPIRFAGYPGGPHGGWTLFAAHGLLTTVSDGLVHYDIETFKSNSGGPVWRETQRGPELVAIHVTNGGGRVVDEEFARETNRLIAELERRATERGY